MGGSVVDPDLVGSGVFCRIYESDTGFVLKLLMYLWAKHVTGSAVYNIVQWMKNRDFNERKVRERENRGREERL